MYKIVPGALICWNKPLSLCVSLRKSGGGTGLVQESQLLHSP